MQLMQFISNSPNDASNGPEPELGHVLKNNRNRTVSALTTASQKSVASMNKLSAQEQEAFEFAEETIRNGLESYLTVGLALLTVRENKWYNSLGYENDFDRYVIDRFKISHNYANKLMRAAFVAKRIAASEPSGTNENWYNCTNFNASQSTLSGTDSLSITLPQNESIARPLTKLPTDEQAQLWRGVVEEAKQSGVTITAARVQQAVDAHQGKIHPPETTPALEVQPTPNTSVKPFNPLKVLPTQVNGTSSALAKSEPEIPKVLWRHEAEVVAINMQGEDISTRFTIRDLPDGTFQIWSRIFKRQGSKIVDLGGRQEDAKASLSAAQKYVVEHIESQFSVNPSARIVYPGDLSVTERDAK